MMIDKIKKYFEGRKWHWWASNVLFWGIIVVLLVPSWRLQVSTQINRLFLSAPTIEKNEAAPITSLDWPMLDMSGNRVNLNQSSGKVIFINSWATWCGPCRAEMPSMNDLFLNYKDKVDFYFISTDSIPVLESFNEKMKYEFPMYSSTYAPEIFNISSIPVTFVLNKKGQIVFTKKGTSDWNSPSVHQFLDELLNQ
jgi:thiol-disulfide isomerase/thioredoxin